MAQISIQNVLITGLEDPTFSSATAAGDTFNNEGVKTFYLIDNASGGAITATFDDINSITPTGAVAFDPDVDVVVGAGSRQYIGPFPTTRFGTTVTVTYSADTSVTVAALRL